MRSFSLLFFLMVIINAYSGFYVFLANRSASVNKTFLLTCLTLCVWGIGYTFLLPSENAETANWWRVLATLGECFLFSSFLLFSITFTKPQGLLSRGWMKGLLFLPSILFFLYSLPYSEELLVRTAWGWMYTYDAVDFWQESFLLYYLSYVLAAVWLIYSWGCQAVTAREKRQARLIVGVTLLALVTGITLDALLPVFGIKALSADVVVLTLVTCGIWYSIVRYRFLVLNFELAALYILSDMIDPLLLTDRNLVITEANHAAAQLTGCHRLELIGKSINDILGGQLEVAASGSAGYKNVQNLEVMVNAEQANQIPCLLSVKTLYDEFYGMLGRVILLHDITKRKDYEQLLQRNNDELEQKVSARTAELESINSSLEKEIAERKKVEARLRHNATHDILTALPNRRLYQKRLSDALNRAQESGNILAVLYLDMDNFKFLNDTFGHNYGDLVLKEVALHMQKTLKPEDVLARVGGDEFLFLLDRLDRKNALERIREVADALLKMFARPYYINGRECFLSVSIGAAIYPEDGVDVETLVKNADIAMYEAKETGKSMYKICSAEIKYRVAEKAEIRSRMFHALDNKEFFLHYQPQIDVVSRKIKGFEALLRWRASSGQSISPSKFIPIAEETGLIVPIGKWVMQQAFNQLKVWHNLGCTDLRMAVNVSARQLVEKDFVKELVACLDFLQLDHKLIELEITESIAFKKNQDILLALAEIKAENINLSIDDFGTEYSSFMNIKDVPISRLKIAMPFVSGIGKNVKDAAIVSSIIALSHNMGMNVIAEGVETAEEVEYLGGECCDEIQGYYFYKPMLPEDVGLILKNNLESRGADRTCLLS